MLFYVVIGLEYQEDIKTYIFRQIYTEIDVVFFFT